MNEHDATEQSYRNGYEKGYAEGKRDAVKKGRWGKVYTCHGERLWGYSCDQCKAENGKKSNYCPHCGADMRGEEDA